MTNQVMTENGISARPMDKAPLLISKERITKVLGSTTEDMDSESQLIPTEAHTMASGLRGPKRELAKRNGQMAPTSLDITRMERRTGSESTFGPMAPPMRETGLTLKSTDSDCTNGPISASSRGSGKTAKFKDLEFTYGRMAAVTKDFLRKTKGKATEFTRCRIKILSQARGLMVASMALAAHSSRTQTKSTGFGRAETGSRNLLKSKPPKFRMVL